jgi:hypothetical protein
MNITMKTVRVILLISNSYPIGKETLKIYGDVPADFDKENLLKEFRKSVAPPSPEQPKITLGNNIIIESTYLPSDPDNPHLQVIYVAYWRFY